MPRRCYVCGSRYAGGGQCTVPECPRNYMRLRDVRAAQQVSPPPEPPPATARAALSEAGREAAGKANAPTRHELRVVARHLVDLLLEWKRAYRQEPDDDTLEDDVIAAAQLLGLSVNQPGTGSNG